MKETFKIPALPVWSEAEIDFRDHCSRTIYRELREGFENLNRAWTFHRIEAPTLMPVTALAPGYDAADVWMLPAAIGDTELCLSPETTASSYAYALSLGVPAPVCVWQVRKSYRRETNDGASASKLRFKEFYQQEFQFIYRDDTKADYAETAHEITRYTLGKLLGQNVSLEPSDRLPSYATRTMDVVSKWKRRNMEVCSISERTDFPRPGFLVLEIAVGLDRLVKIGMTQ